VEFEPEPQGHEKQKERAEDRGDGAEKMQHLPRGAYGFKGLLFDIRMTADRLGQPLLISSTQSPSMRYDHPLPY
jgi:hypothetical protein